MTNIEIVKTAIALIREIHNIDFRIAEIKPWHTSTPNGVELDVWYTDKQGEFVKQNFGFVEPWFDINDNPLNLNKKCGMDKVDDQDSKLILRLAYYLINWYKKKVK